MEMNGLLLSNAILSNIMETEYHTIGKVLKANWKIMVQALK